MTMMPPGMGGMPGVPGMPGGMPGMPPGMGGGVMPPGMGPAQFGDSMPGMNADGSFDLSLSDDVVPPSEFEPVPAGTYNLFASKVEVTPTKAGEPMIVVHWALDGAVYGVYEGRVVRDKCVVPGPHRREEVAKDGRDKWTVMMGMLRDWLEAITGRPWRDNQMNLNPARDLSSLTVQAIVTLEPYTTTDGKAGVNNRIGRYLQAGGVRASSPFGMPAPGVQAPSMPAQIPPVPGIQSPPQPGTVMSQPQVPQMQVAPEAMPQVQAIQEQQFVPPAPPAVPQAPADLGDDPTQVAPSLGEPATPFDV